MFSRSSETPQRAPVAPASACDERDNVVYVCSLAELPIHAEAIKPSHLVSLVLSHEQPPTPPCVEPLHHLRLELDDIDEPLPGHIPPEAAHVERLIDFARGWSGEMPLLVHCAAGVSRSMAAGLVAVCVKSEADERSIAGHLRRVAPHAHPNRRIIALADGLLNRGGRLIAAVEAMGPAAPVIGAPLVRFPVDVSAALGPSSPDGTIGVHSL